MTKATSDTAPEPAAQIVTVHGRVQGVGFRWFTRDCARNLAIRGSVRNRADGTVEVIAIGNQQALTTLRNQLRSGPAAARVTELSVETTPVPFPVPGGFQIVE